MEVSSLDTAPVTVSLLSAVSVRRHTISQAAVFRLCVLIKCNECLRLAVCRALRFLQRLRVDFVMATGSDTLVEARSGITFDVILEVPWKVPDAYVQLHSDGVFDLEKTVPDVLGLCGRRPYAAVVRVMQGCDARSVRAFIPAVSEADLSLLRRQWPVTVVQSLTWLHNELDVMRAAAKKRY